MQAVTVGRPCLLPDAPAIFQPLALLMFHRKFARLKYRRETCTLAQRCVCGVCAIPAWRFIWRTGHA
jgi:hypothetical protein